MLEFESVYDTFRKNRAKMYRKQWFSRGLRYKYGKNVSQNVEKREIAIFRAYQAGGVQQKTAGTGNQVNPHIAQ